MTTTLGPYEVHPAADAFPMLDGEQFDELVHDILENGLRQPIVLDATGEKLIDGRNRYRACEAAQVDAVFERLGEFYTEEMVLDYIVSQNIHRRHLNPGQRAMAALALEPMYAKVAKKVQAENGRDNSGNLRNVADLRHSEDEVAEGPLAKPSAAELISADHLAELNRPQHERKSTARAAKAVGASPRAVQQAKAVERDAPDLAKDVRDGRIALDAADRERKKRIASMPKPDPMPAKSKPTVTPLILRTHDGKEVEYPRPSGKSTFNETTGPGISWAAWSWNPVTGCLHGCDYCYAREIATSDRFKAAYPVGFTPLFHSERLEAPANTSIPSSRRDDPAYRRVFVCSMADLYGRWIPDEWIEQVHASMCASPEWQYITLTKFPSRYVGLTMPAGAWIGTSVDEQKRVRIAEDAFRKIEGVAVKWLSLEPLREPLEFTDLSMFDWIVIGAQTETRQPSGRIAAFAPPFEWVSRIVAQAREAGCKVHLKPNLLGATSPSMPGMQMPDEYPEASVP